MGHTLPASSLPKKNAPLPCSSNFQRPSSKSHVRYNQVQGKDYNNRSNRVIRTRLHSFNDSEFERISSMGVSIRLPNSRWNEQQGINAPFGDMQNVVAAAPQPFASISRSCPPKLGASSHAQWYIVISQCDFQFGMV